MNGTAPFRLHGIAIPWSHARRANDGTYVFEADTDRPVQRWRSELDMPVRKTERQEAS